MISSDRNIPEFDGTKCISKFNIDPAETSDNWFSKLLSWMRYNQKKLEAKIFEEPEL